MLTLTALAKRDDDAVAIGHAGDGVRVAGGADLAGVLELKFGRYKARVLADDDAILLYIAFVGGGPREIGMFEGVGVGIVIAIVLIPE